jgi:hypothetical protein
MREQDQTAAKVVGGEDVNPEREAAKDSDPERGGDSVYFVLQKAKPQSEHQSPESENVRIAPFVSHSPGGEKSGSEDDVERRGHGLSSGTDGPAQ